MSLASLTAPSADADCDGPVPSFREHAAKAERVVIGDVVDVDLTANWTDDEGRSSHFVMNVKYVLRGAPEPTMIFQDLEFLPCADHIVIARKGDRIALAMGITAFDPPFTFSTVAWVEGTPPDFVGIERTTVRDAFLLLALDPPADEVALQPVDEPVPVGAIAVVVIAIGVALALLWRRSLARQLQ